MVADFVSQIYMQQLGTQGVRLPEWLVTEEPKHVHLRKVKIVKRMALSHLSVFRPRPEYLLTVHVKNHDLLAKHRKKASRGTNAVSRRRGQTAPFASRQPTHKHSRSAGRAQIPCTPQQIVSDPRESPPCPPPQIGDHILAIQPGSLGFQNYPARLLNLSFSQLQESSTIEGRQSVLHPEVKHRITVPFAENKLYRRAYPPQAVSKTTFSSDCGTRLRETGMLSSVDDGLAIRSRLQFSQPSQPSASQVLNCAFRECNIADATQYTQKTHTFCDITMTQTQTQPQTSQLTDPRISSLEGGLGSQDFLTPAEQQFQTDPSVGGKKMRSPAKMSPKGNKRQKSLLSGSQISQGQPTAFPPDIKRLARDARFSPRCTHNSFVNDMEPESRVTRRLPAVTMYREVFKELKTLGQGNFSKVFNVKNRMDGLEYAVKRSKKEVSDEALQKQWYQEIQALAAAGMHPNIVRYYFAWVEEQRDGVHFYIQLEKCGSSLGQRLCVDRRPLREAELVEIVRQLAAALQHLHSQGIAHMDVKPDNIYTASEGTYKLGDFGMATSLNCHPNIAIEEGDCKYLPSEVMNGNYNRLDKADMFSLGVTLYQLATGHEPPESGEQYMNLRQGKIRLIPGYSNSFQAMLKQLMSRDPTERPSPAKLLSDKFLNKQAGYKQLDLRPAGS